MGISIWFTEDIRNALLAANEASAATAAVITSAPDSYAGQWSKWRGAWDVLT